MAVSSIHNGWRYEPSSTRLSIYYRGTRGASTTATGSAFTGTMTSTGLLTASAAVTVTTGNLTNTADDHRVTAGNVRLGAINTFASTEPTSALVMKSGTAFAGAITTSGGLQSNDTTVQKVIADGTVNNVET